VTYTISTIEKKTHVLRVVTEKGKVRLKEAVEADYSVLYRPMSEKDEAVAEAAPAAAGAETPGAGPK